MSAQLLELLSSQLARVETHTDSQWIQIRVHRRRNSLSSCPNFLSYQQQLLKSRHFTSGQSSINEMGTYIDSVVQIGRTCTVQTLGYVEQSQTVLRRVETMGFETLIVVGHGDFHIESATRLGSETWFSHQKFVLLVVIMMVIVMHVSQDIWSNVLISTNATGSRLTQNIKYSINNVRRVHIQIFQCQPLFGSRICSNSFGTKVRP